VRDVIDSPRTHVPQSGTYALPAQLVATPVMVGNNTVNACAPFPAQSYSPILLDLGVALRMKI